MPGAARTAEQRLGTAVPLNPEALLHWWCTDPPRYDAVLFSVRATL